MTAGRPYMPFSKNIFQDFLIFWFCIFVNSHILDSLTRHNYYTPTIPHTSTTYPSVYHPKPVHHDCCRCCFTAQCRCQCHSHITLFLSSKPQPLYVIIVVVNTTVILRRFCRQRHSHVTVMLSSTPQSHCVIVVINVTVTLRYFSCRCCCCQCHSHSHNMSLSLFSTAQ